MIRLHPLVTGLLVFSAGCSEPAAPARAVYVLCAANVTTVEVVPAGAGGSIGVAVQLSPAATRELESFSGEHVGRELEITFADRVFLRAPVQKPIRSGLLINHGFEDATQARAARDEVRAGLPEGPCGPES